MKYNNKIGDKLKLIIKTWINQSIKDGLSSLWDCSWKLLVFIKDRLRHISSETARVLQSKCTEVYVLVAFGCFCFVWLAKEAGESMHYKCIKNKMLTL